MKESFKPISLSEESRRKIYKTNPVKKLTKYPNFITFYCKFEEKKKTPL